MQLFSKPDECASLVITTNFNFRQWVGWVTAMLCDRRLQGDEFEAVNVAVGSIRARRGVRKRPFPVLA